MAGLPESTIVGIRVPWNMNFTEKQENPNNPGGN